MYGKQIRVHWNRTVFLIRFDESYTYIYTSKVNALRKCTLLQKKYIIYNKNNFILKATNQFQTYLLLM